MVKKPFERWFEIKKWEKLPKSEQEAIKQQIRKQNEEKEHFNEYEAWCRQEHKKAKKTHPDTLKINPKSIQEET